MTFPVVTSHNFTAPSPLPDTARVASAESAADQMGEASERLRKVHPVAMSHTRSAPSRLLDRMRLPSDENATDEMAAACPENVDTMLPVLMSHSFNVLSSP